MHYLCGPRQLLETVVNLSCKSGEMNSKPRDLIELKIALGVFLRKIQPEVPAWRADLSDGKGGPSWIRDQKTLNDLVRQFQNKSALNDRNQAGVIGKIVTNSSQSDQVYSNLQQALEGLEKLDLNLGNSIRLSVTSVFHSPSHLAGGGSSSGSIGVIWANPRGPWTLQDHMEFLVHETTHTLMFLDELRYRHYTNYSDLAKEQNFALSAILKKSRPLDKVIHSLVVGTEILLLRDRLLGHPTTPRLHPTTPMMEKQCVDTIESLSSLFSINPDLVTKRIIDLVDLCSAAIAGINSRKGNYSEHEKNLALAN